MMLTRADLESDRLRKLFMKANPHIPVMSSEEIETSLQRLLASHPCGEDVWLFGYGSLIWNPIIQFQERHVARLHGYHRRFCLWSHIGRGSLTQPGLVLGLDVGGCCQGVVFRIDTTRAANELRLVWRREMVLGSYCPRWVSVAIGERSVRALTFVVNRTHTAYAGRLPMEVVLRTMVSASGYLGTPAEYLMRTIHALLEHGVRDEYLLELRKRVLALQPDVTRAA